MAAMAKLRKISEKFLHFYLLCLMLFISFICVNCKTIVETKYGKINGKIETFRGKEMVMFLGIPYAEPPLGQFRFKKPIPLKQQWKDTRDATQWPNACLQLYTGIEELILTVNQSEDCLYLNVFVPLSHEINNDTNPKAVMMWIHSGGLFTGSSSDMTSPHRLSIGGDVIVVSIHYRLGTFGFLYSGTDDAPGNVGLWDQVLALKWVNENIKHFGGDSQKITIFGVSAGGWSVSLHILSPASRHLFQNAIVMSGAVYGDNLSYDPNTAKRLWSKAAQSIGCGKNDTEVTSLTPETFECLQNADYKKLLSLYTNLKSIPKTLNFPKLIVYDTEFLPKRSHIMLKEGNYKKNLNLMIGFTNDEGSFLLPLMINPQKYGKNKMNLTRDNAIHELKKYSSLIDTKIAVNGADVSELYYNGIPKDLDLLPRTIGISIGDFILSCPTFLFAKSVYSGDHHSRVYQYYYSRKSHMSDFCRKWMGACHLIDILYVGGVPFIKTKEYTDDDRRHSENIMNMFGHFVKYGNPSPQFGIDWPKYYTINGHTITPYYEFSHNESVDNSFGKGLKHDECEILWKYYFEN